MGTTNENDDVEPTASTESADVPDGGWGWVVAIGCLTINVIYDGCSYSFGILFVNLLDYFGDTKSNTAWIGSLFFSVPLLCGPLASIAAEKFGYRKATMVGGVIAAAGFAFGSMANSTWVLCLCYGLISGFGMSIPYFTASVAVAKYFRRRLALAAGIAECGAGLGTVIFAPLTEYLISAYGWRGALLIVSGVVGNIVVCGALIRPVKRKQLKLVVNIDAPLRGHNEETHAMITNHSVIVNASREKAASDLCLSKSNNRSYAFENDLKHIQNDIVHFRELHNVRLCRSLLSLNNIESRGLYKSLPILVSSSNSTDTKDTLQHQSVVQKLKRRCQNLAPLFSLPFLAFTMSNFIMYFWYDVPYVFTVDRAISLGIQAKDATFLISLIGIVHTVGNIMYGLMGDRDCINVPLLYGVSLILCGVSMFVVPLCFDYASLAITAACFGLFSAATETLCAIIIVQTVGVKMLNQGFGLVMLLEGVANLVGPPIAGFLCDVTGKYDATFFVSGACVIAGGSLYTLLRLFIMTKKRRQ